MTHDRACPYMDDTQLCISTINSDVEHCALSFYCEHPSSQKHMRGRTSPTETNPVTLLHRRACWGRLHAASYSAKDHLKPTAFVTRGYSLLKTATPRLQEGEGGHDAEQSVVSNFKSIPDHWQTPASKRRLEKHTLQKDPSTHTLLQ